MKTQHALRCAVLTLTVCASTLAVGAGDFSRSSCKTWNGTVVAISGVDTPRARMSGIITRADVREYCERDPGSETTANRGRLTLEACVDKYYRENKGIKLKTWADCQKASLEFHDGPYVKRVRFPVEDISCGSGNPPLIDQFIKLCPTRAREPGMVPW